MLLFFLSLTLKGQYKFQNLRFNDDFKFLANDTVSDWYKKFKYTKLGTVPSSFISQGGEVRYLFQHYTNEDWGSVPAERYNSFYTRFLYHTDIHISKYFRVFGQLNSSFAIGRVTPIRTIDQNVLDIQQLFFDVNPTNHLSFRFGRQELLYGIQRLIAVREGPNNRQSYDAAKISWKRENMKIDMYYSHPVRLQVGIFDDKFNEREKLWSSYVVLNTIALLKNIDVYYIGFYSRQKAYLSGINEELRHSLGTRIWHKSDTWNYDFETLYQFGNWGKQNISAYTISADINYTFANTQTSPTIGLKTEIISGDRDTNDAELNTFNPLYPRGAYFGLAALIGPVNLIDFHPSISFKPLKNLDISFDYDVFWRHSNYDGIYGPNVILIFEPLGSSRFIGHQIGASIEYQPTPFIKITPEAMWFFAGAYLKEASPGKQVFFGAFTAQFKF